MDKLRRPSKPSKEIIKIIKIIKITVEKWIQYKTRPFKKITQVSAKQKKITQPH